MNRGVTNLIANLRKDAINLYDILKREKKVSFFNLFPVVSREYIVATFLAILEMAKAQELFIVQDKTFDDIICEVR